MSVLQRNLIMTVSGPITSAELGFCHSHEHLFIADGPSARIHPALRIDSYAATLAELVHYQRTGGRSIVDAQPLGCGRMAEALCGVARESGVQIIAATGFHKLVFYPEDHWIHSLDEVKLAQLYQSEFESGMYSDGDTALPGKRSAAKPGIIKTASDTAGITKPYRKLFEAAAMTAKATGAPILSHTEMGKAALQQIRFFQDYGLAADALIICHVDRVLDDLDYPLAVAETGVYLELDTIGRFKYHSDAAEVALILKMVERGHEDRILLGLDVTRERLKSYGGAIGLDYIRTTFIPLLQKAGLTDEVIAKFMIHNPARALRYQKMN